MQASLKLDFNLNTPQSQFLNLPQKYRALVAGYGTGKSVTGCVSSLTHYWEHPKVNQGYFAPTYPQIRDIYFPTIEEVAFYMGLRVDIKESNKEVHIYNGRFYRGTTICRSMEKPSTIIGFKIGHAHIDEIDVLDAKKAKEAWRKIIARLRWMDGAIKNGADVTTTPEGFKETYRLFVQEIQKNPKLADSYGLVQASTYQNEANLPEDYIQSLIDTYPEALIDAYLRGQFVNLTSGTVYRSYNRVTHNSTETIQPNDILRIGMDFNVQKMAATFYVVRPNGWHAVAELKDLLDTPDMIRVIKEKYQGHRMIVYPDATGKNREANNASTSDIALLRMAGFEVKAHSLNPAVKDRINSTNKQFEVGHLWVNAKECPTVASNFEQQAYDDNGEPDKKGGFDHQNDASTYPIAYEFPIVRTMQRIKTIG
jgi:phage terminase large subunit